MTITPVDALRMERAEVAAWRAEEECADRRLKVGEFGEHAVAFAVPERQSTLFNRALALTAADAAAVPDIVAWYADVDIPPRFDVCPLLGDDALEAALRDAGLEPGGFPFFARRILAGRPVLPPADERETTVTVRRAGDNEAATFLALRHSVWPMVPTERARRTAALAANWNAPGLAFYFAEVDGEPVGIASTYMHNGVCVLHLGAMRETFRCRGGHTALIRRRLADAISGGADLVCSLVAPDGESNRNLDRAGLAHAYDRVLWLPSDWTDHPFYRETSPPPGV